MASEPRRSARPDRATEGHRPLEPTSFVGLEEHPMSPSSGTHAMPGMVVTRTHRGGRPPGRGVHVRRRRSRRRDGRGGPTGPRGWSARAQGSRGGREVPAAHAKEIRDRPGLGNGEARYVDRARTSPVPDQLEPRTGPFALGPDDRTGQPDRRHDIAPGCARRAPRRRSDRLVGQGNQALSFEAPASFSPPIGRSGGPRSHRGRWRGSGRGPRPPRARWRRLGRAPTTRLQRR